MTDSDRDRSGKRIRDEFPARRTTVGHHARMLRPTLSTRRIELRPMTLDHLHLLHTLDSDPEVMRHLLGRARTPAEIDAFWAPRCADMTGDDAGLGWWVGFDHDTFLGWWDLGRSDSDPAGPLHADAPEIGWRLRRDRWRQGLASEGALALLQHAFDTVCVDRVWAETMAVNAGSRGVMRRIGMQHVRTYHAHYGDPLPGTERGEVVYEVTREQWQANRDRS